MSALTATAEDQITLRREVLQHLCVEAGQKVELAPPPDHGISLWLAAVGGGDREGDRGAGAGE